MVYTTTLNALTLGASQTITFTMPFTATELWAYGDPDRVIAESDEDNSAD